VSTLTSLGLFVGFPVVFGIVVYVLVSASSWTRSGRVSADYDDGPFTVTSDPAVPDPSHLPRDIGQGAEAFVGGGASAKW
jgi:hypothetical protein